MTSEAARFYWLRFSRQELVAKTNEASSSAYLPQVIADGLSLVEFKPLLDKMGRPAAYEHFLANAESGTVCCRETLVKVSFRFTR